MKIRIDEPKEGISTSEDNSEEKSDIQVANLLLSFKEAYSMYVCLSVIKIS